jgi:hypothetical protein
MRRRIVYLRRPRLAGDARWMILELPAGAHHDRITQIAAEVRAASDVTNAVSMTPGLSAGPMTIGDSRIVPSVPMAATTRASRSGVATTSPCP